MVYDRPRDVRVFESRAVIREVFGGGDGTRVLQALDESGAHTGYERRIVPVGAAPDRSSRSCIYNGRQVGVHTPAPELASYALRDAARLLRVRPTPHLRRRGLRRDPRGALYLPTLVV